MRNLCAIASVVSFLVPAVLGTAVMAEAPLAPGEPAGVKKAQDTDHNTLLYVVGLGLIGGGIALLASGDSDHPGTPPSTTPTTTTSSTST